ncbi:hypothetical protein DM01DRAFT_1129536 [Hesseltinella vesiculosa]|uniref:Uncharacterized protein n=1 Tax=Hesseltinella vesiculosa TaxID=101127 RepID=A0A1X2GUX3_9FUNG|nr:hypothetical protein DM01DRAFT_1129536 [Hesseltinella vesiculosa]
MQRSKGRKRQNLGFFNKSKTSSSDTTSLCSSGNLSMVGASRAKRASRSSHLTVISEAPDSALQHHCPAADQPPMPYLVDDAFRHPFPTYTDYCAGSNMAPYSSSRPATHAASFFGNFRVPGNQPSPLAQQPPSCQIPFHHPFMTDPSVSDHPVPYQRLYPKVHQASGNGNGQTNATPVMTANAHPFSYQLQGVSSVPLAHLPPTPITPIVDQQDPYTRPFKPLSSYLPDAVETRVSMRDLHRHLPLLSPSPQPSTRRSVVQPFAEVCRPPLLTPRPPEHAAQQGPIHSSGAMKSKYMSEKRSLNQIPVSAHTNVPFGVGLSPINAWPHRFH